MKKLFSETEFETAKGTDKLPLECLQCSKIFYATKTRLRTVIAGTTKAALSNCSYACGYASRRAKRIKISCTECNITFEKCPAEFAKTVCRGHKHFCSKSCASKYNNRHKKFGCTRSKLEIWLEEQLTQKYPNLAIKYNDRLVISAELDFYIPSLNLAFELNGIFHYEPIFGKEKFAKVQNNDARKFQACLEKGIEFCTLNASSIRNFNPQQAQPFLDIMTRIIDSKLNQ